MIGIPVRWTELSTTGWRLAPCFGWIPPRSDTLVPSSSYSFLRSSPRQDWSSQSVDQPQDVLEQTTRYGDFGHLEGDVPTMGDCLTSTPMGHTEVIA